jgi:hypothetical protein
MPTGVRETAKKWSWPVVAWLFGTGFGFSPLKDLQSWLLAGLFWGVGLVWLLVLVGLAIRRRFRPGSGREAERRAIRTRLGELLSEGDMAAAAVQMTLSRITSGGDNEIIPKDRVATGAPPGIREAQEWADGVDDYFRETPDLGEVYVALFNAQDGMPVLPEKRPLALENRLRTALEGIRVRQGRLRQFIADFKD